MKQHKPISKTHYNSSLLQNPCCALRLMNTNYTSPFVLISDCTGVLRISKHNDRTTPPSKANKYLMLYSCAPQPVFYLLRGGAGATVCATSDAITEMQIYELRINKYNSEMENKEQNYSLSNYSHFMWLDCEFFCALNVKDDYEILLNINFSNHGHISSHFIRSW